MTRHDGENSNVHDQAAATPSAKALIEALQGRIRELEEENAELRGALRLVASPKRPDGTYNRSREACEQLAREVLGDA